MAEFDVAVRTPVRHGRSPVWDSRTDTVLWVDRPAASAHRYSPGRGTDAAMPTPQPVGAALPRARGGLLLHLDEGLALFEADGATRTWLAYWARDGFCAVTTAVDLHGRAWAASAPLAAPARFRGGLPAAEGRDSEEARSGGHEQLGGHRQAAGHGQAAGGGGWLVRVAASGPVRTGPRALPDPRGLAFAPDGARLYLADGSTGRLEVLALDPEGGELGERRPLVEPGAPVGGLCVDAAGCPWVALPGAGAVHRYTPEGVLDREVVLAGHRPTDCCFGGTRLTDLYVTTGGGDAGAEDPAALLVVPEAGEGVRTPAFAG
ncbi:SMP-30/gluconolactonase/LRE family protein [Salinifilum ghardaiensis]